MNRKKRRRIKRIVLNLLFLLIIAGGGVIALLFFKKTRPLPESFIPGEYSTAADISAEAASKGQDWLNAAYMGEEADMASVLGELELSLKLNMGSDGSYSITLDEESIKKAEERAQAALADAFCDLAVLRLKAAGEGDYDRESARTRTEDKLGMSLTEYMKDYGPDMVRDAAELKAEYERSGSWEVKEGVLYMDGQPLSSFAASEAIFVYDPGNGAAVKVWKRIK